MIRVRIGNFFPITYHYLIKIPRKKKSQNRIIRNSGIIVMSRQPRFVHDS